MSAQIATRQAEIAAIRFNIERGNGLHHSPPTAHSSIPAAHITASTAAAGSTKWRVKRIARVMRTPKI